MFTNRDFGQFLALSAGILAALLAAVTFANWFVHYAQTWSY